MYAVMKHIYDSPMKSWLMTKDENDVKKNDECILNTIPTCTVYKAAQQMAEVKRQIAE